MMPTTPSDRLPRRSLGTAVLGLALMALSLIHI